MVNGEWKNCSFYLPLTIYYSPTCHLSLVTCHALNHLRARMVFGVANNRYAPAVASYHVALRYGLFGVISPFGVNVWANVQEERFDGRLVEDSDKINSPE